MQCDNEDHGDRFGLEHMRKGRAVLFRTKDGLQRGKVTAWGSKGVTLELINGKRGALPYAAVLAIDPPDHVLGLGKNPTALPTFEDHARSLGVYLRI